ncbi:hypothetical protein AVEN_193864-1 [Araneus ventricosus]|uniref:Uncharacterized protein n=1 Tax=Araneus ventricosus TaxID=182803 RepID=A0A4Y2V804_ARAVE|nr:hypothetical protein AVEN_193864-1 [Araneus ventricosus]
MCYGDARNTVLWHAAVGVNSTRHFLCRYRFCAWLIFLAMWIAVAFFPSSLGLNINGEKHVTFAKRWFSVADYAADLPRFSRVRYAVSSWLLFYDGSQCFWFVDVCFSLVLQLSARGE